MKARYTVALSVLGGLAIGAGAVQTIHAQAKPPAYVIAEVEVTNPTGYDKEYVPGAAKAIGDGGGKYVVRGGQVAPFFGEPPKGRVVVMVFDSLDKAQAAFNSPGYKAAKKEGDKYANFRVFAVEGLPQ
jgi:uncharacterized protein (DUF1330 family)